VRQRAHQHRQSYRIAVGKRAGRLRGGDDVDHPLCRQPARAAVIVRDTRSEGIQRTLATSHLAPYLPRRLPTESPA
jgi:hypothetical protein